MRKRSIFCSALLAVLALVGGGNVWGAEDAAALVAAAAEREAAGDIAQACDLYYKAATECNSAEALRRLGLIILEGRGVEANPADAVMYFTSAANLGDVEAIYQLGLCYFNGLGVEKDVLRAVELWKSIAGRLADADYSLGMCYLKGWGTPTNPDLAFRHLYAAASLGHVQAKCELALLYEMGMGTAQDYGMAYKLLSEAAEDGDPQAEYHLGRFYEDGIGVQRNIEYAYVYYYRARYRGYRNADRRIVYIEKSGFKPRNAHPPVPKGRFGDGRHHPRMHNPNRSHASGVAGGNAGYHSKGGRPSAAPGGKPPRPRIGHGGGQHPHPQTGAGSSTHGSNRSAHPQFGQEGRSGNSGRNADGASRGVRPPRPRVTGNNTNTGSRNRSGVDGSRTTFNPSSQTRTGVRPERGSLSRTVRPERGSESHSITIQPSSRGTQRTTTRRDSSERPSRQSRRNRQVTTDTQRTPSRQGNTSTQGNMPRRGTSGQPRMRNGRMVIPPEER